MVHKNLYSNSIPNRGISGVYSLSVFWSKGLQQVRRSGYKSLPTIKLGKVYVRKPRQNRTEFEVEFLIQECNNNCKQP